MKKDFSTCKETNHKFLAFLRSLIFNRFVNQKTTEINPVTHSTLKRGCSPSFSGFLKHFFGEYLRSWERHKKSLDELWLCASLIFNLIFHSFLMRAVISYIRIYGFLCCERCCVYIWNRRPLFCCSEREKSKIFDRCATLVHVCVLIVYINFKMCIFLMPLPHLLILFASHLSHSISSSGNSHENNFNSVMFGVSIRLITKYV